MSAGAFSDATVVEAAERLTCVFVECEWGKKNADLSSAYKVSGFPTVLFCDPDGQVIGQLQSHEPAAVAKQMLDVAAKFGSKAELPAQPIELQARQIPDALAVAAKFKLPVLLFFRDDSPGTMSVATALNDPAVKKLLERIVVGTDVFTKGAGHSATYGITRAPTLLVLDPSLPKPELARIEGSRSARELIRELEALAARASAAADPAAPPTTAPRPAPKEPEEKLSDDEIERRFIAARVSVAKDMMKQGKKEKAIEVYEDIIKTYPKHVDTVGVKKLLQEARK